MSLYDEIGAGYSAARRTDPRIAAPIWRALGDARTVLNVGAGTGSYEPRDREVTAVEPSAVMREQRSTPAVAARAEALPFADGAFDAGMAVLSDHHWTDPIAGLRELARVARRVVVLSWEPAERHRAWLVRDYFNPRGLWTDLRPTLAERAAAIDATLTPVPVPHDCVDGFLLAFWRRPAAYLDPAVRAGHSSWALLGAEHEAAIVAALRADLDSGAWPARNRDLLEAEASDQGFRLLVR